MIHRDQKKWVWVAALALILVGAALYWPVHSFEFINLDDPTYVLENPKVTRGLTWTGLTWGLTEFYGANWHPLAWWSHMLDVSLFGLNPTGHHLVNLALHALNAGLLFLLLHRLTGAYWRSLFVAALFVCHPTHVESVAWVSERKDVLCACFGLLSLLAYSRYVASTRIRAGATRIWYGVTLALFTLGLLSKPMLVTWPFVMLLMDFWPLTRTSPAGPGKLGAGVEWWSLVREKIPFFVLSAGSCVMTFLAQQAGGAVQSVAKLSFAARAENAVVSYLRYFGKTFWPVDLSVYYPHPVSWPLGTVAGAIMILGACVGLALWQIRNRRYLFVGLAWFLGTMVPVIGLVQVGGQSIADRYLYIPQIGMLIGLVWVVAELVQSHRTVRSLAASGAICAVIAYSVATREYLANWQNSNRLFNHALKVDANNPPALYGLGLVLAGEGRYDEAFPYFEKAASLSPGHVTYEGQIALVLASRGNVTAAIKQYQKCLEVAPQQLEVLNNLAWILATTFDAKDRDGVRAVQLARRACELTDYDWPIFIGTLAASYAEAGQFQKAIEAGLLAEHKARERGMLKLAETNARLLREYHAGRPYREPISPQNK